uniref:Protein xylosyltransferase n=1 Tax=Trichobilharzia regenti TaxID=157069 RepID=A0AA85JI59_TRIRE|nr:unnamed protein product [Trichobilharzia regenti]
MICLNSRVKKLLRDEIESVLRTFLLIFCLIAVFSFHKYFCTKKTKFASSDHNNNDVNSYINYTYLLTEEELNFPLAFSVITYRDFDRAFRLIKAIYRPNNVYCIHTDKNTNSIEYTEFVQYVQQLGENIYFVPEDQRVHVVWGRYSVLEADLNCAKLLLAKSKKWRYFINLTGHEFPLRTNWELVKALKALNGLNVAPAHCLQSKPWRIPPKRRVPLDIVWYEGPVHVALRREFVEYMLYNEKALILLESLKKHEKVMRQCTIPDEQYFTILNNNPQTFQIPGVFQGSFKQEENYFVLTRVKLWWFHISKCHTNIYRNAICMLGSGDLPLLKKHPHFFANKFLPDVEPEAYDELERWLADKVLYEHNNNRTHPSFLYQYYVNYTWAQTHNLTFNGEF